MTWRGTVGLVMATAVLAAVAWWSRHPAPEHRPRTEPPLLDPADAPTALDVHVAGDVHRTERAPTGWHTTSDAIRPERIPGLLDALRTLSPLMTVDENPTTPGEFGLDRNAVRLVAWDGGTRLLDLDVGGRNPAWTGVYVRRHGARRVEMVGALLLWEMTKVLPSTATKSTLTKRQKTGEPSGAPPAKEAP